MTIWLSLGLLFSYGVIIWVLLRWGGEKIEGTTPASLPVFIAILFTSGLDVGLIMFPLTEFGTYADHVSNPEYGFASPVAIEFGFWGVMVWSIYFLTCFYFCVLEPKIQFFQIPAVKWCHNLVVIGTCAFTAYLLLSNLGWYLPVTGGAETAQAVYYAIVLAVIAAAVYSSTDIRYVRFLSVSTSGLFLALVLGLWINAELISDSSGAGVSDALKGLFEYFPNIHKFMLPINDYHEFYLFWWFAWSIMIGQFTARFASRLKTYQLFGAMVLMPSIPIGLWFAVLYHYHSAGLDVTGVVNAAMVVVGVTFVINSLDSLIRLYTDNLNMSVERIGAPKYMAGNFLLLSALLLLFQLDFLQIQWVGGLVISLFFLCGVYAIPKIQKL